MASGRNRTVLIGDIGGRLEVLEEILDSLGVRNSILPSGLTVLQVGDLVRADLKYRDNNDVIINKVDKLIRQNQGRWHQLIGNHESPILGSGFPEAWDVEGSFSVKCRSTIRRLWKDGLLDVSRVVETDGQRVLVTHAGLTRRAWELLGMANDPVYASMLLNSQAAGGIGDFFKPGKLVYGEIRLEADPQWAEVNYELYLPWLEFNDLPFSQIHGHACPFHWPEGDWWPETPSRIRKSLVIDKTRRISTLPLNNERYLRSIDWTLEDSRVEGLWPLLYVDSIIS